MLNNFICVCVTYKVCINLFYFYMTVFFFSILTIIETKQKRVNENIIYVSVPLCFFTNFARLSFSYRFGKVMKLDVAKIFWESQNFSIKYFETNKVCKYGSLST